MVPPYVECSAYFGKPTGRSFGCERARGHDFRDSVSWHYSGSPHTPASQAAETIGVHYYARLQLEEENYGLEGVGAMSKYGCFSRRARLSSQYPHGSSQLSATSVPRNPMPSSGPPRAPGTRVISAQTHRQAKHL